MFAKNVPPGGISNKDAETVIGSSVKVEGNFVCEGNIIVDGEVKGNIETNGFLQIGETSIINADIKASNGKISGQVKGDIKIGGYLELTASAKIYGNVEVGSLSMEKGAILNGQCLMLEGGVDIKKEEIDSEED